MDAMEKVYQYIDEHREEYIQLLKDFCNQPSISPLNIGIQEMAALVRKTLDSLGVTTQRLETKGYPIIYGELPGEAERTLTFYNHYDVQPVDPIEEWDTDPFHATVVDGTLYARGSADNKGSMLSRICAVHAYQKVYGKPPLNLKFIIEGEEEVGSPNLKSFGKAHPEKLKTDGLVWEGGSKNVGGPLQVCLGVKGMCSLELRVRTASGDLHSQYAAIVRNPAWRLVQALATIKDADDNITIDGFYDSVKASTPEEMGFLENLIFDEDNMLRGREIGSFIGELTGVPLKERFLYQPTCNIAGFHSGYAEDGIKTVLPATAVAKLDIRLVFDQRPEEVIKLLRAHLDRRGFADIEIVQEGGKMPYRTDPGSLLARTVINNVERVYGMPPVVYRNSGGTTSMHDLCGDTGIAAVMFGVGDDNSQLHAPNENVKLEDFVNGIKLSATVMHEFAKAE